MNLLSTFIYVFALIILYIAYSAIYRDVLNFPIGITSDSIIYQGTVNSLSQGTVLNQNYEPRYKRTNGWMSSRGDDRVKDEVQVVEEILEKDTSAFQGYVLGWDYYEAQTCAAKNLNGLQRWATSLNFGVVEPFVEESYFKTSVFNNEKALTLRSYFDIDNWNHNVVTRIPHGTPLVSWEHFINKAARQLVVVHVRINSNDGTQVYVNDEVKEETCFSGRGFSNTTLSNYGFKVIRQVCFKFDKRSPLPVDEFNDYILGPFKANNTTIVFTFVPGVSRFRINILEKKYHSKYVDWLKPSKQVINDAKKYIDMFLGKSYVAVSLRTVKMAIKVRSRHPSDLIETAKIVVNKCVDQIAQILSKTSGRHFMTIDIGRFGDPKAKYYMTSATVKEVINKMISVTYNNSWNQEEWENTFINVTNGISDSGYIASLQKEIASHASSLITAGGGSFQNSLELQHNSESSQKHVLQVCPVDDLYVS